MEPIVRVRGAAESIAKQGDDAGRFMMMACSHAAEKPLPAATLPQRTKCRALG